MLIEPDISSNTVFVIEFTISVCSPLFVIVISPPLLDILFNILIRSFSFVIITLPPLLSTAPVNSKMVFPLLDRVTLPSLLVIALPIRVLSVPLFVIVVFPLLFVIDAVD